MRYLLLLAVVVTVGVWNAQAYDKTDYTGYDYFEYFDGSAAVKGSLGSAPAQFEFTVNAADSTLRFWSSGDASGGRNATFTLSNSGVDFADAVVVEFDWAVRAMTGGAGDASLAFRDASNNVIFALSAAQAASGPSVIWVGAGFTASGNTPVRSLPAGQAQALSTLPGTSTNADAESAAAWYRVKAEIDKACRKAKITLTGIRGTIGSESAMVSWPSTYTVNGGVRNIFFDGQRTANFRWGTKITDLGIKSVPTFQGQGPEWVPAMDYSGLNSAISTAQAALAVSGVSASGYLQSAVSDLEDAIATAQGFLTSNVQGDVDGAVAPLNAAVVTFIAARTPLDLLNAAISAAQANLVGITVDVSGGYPQSAVGDLEDAIATAQGLLTSNVRSEVEAAVAPLNAAVATFLATKIPLYVGYDYVNFFDGPTLTGGTIDLAANNRTTVFSTTVGNGPGGSLYHNVDNQGGGRCGAFTLSPQLGINFKSIIEFDYFNETPFNRVTEGRLIIRSQDDEDLFMLSTKDGSPNILVSTGELFASVPFDGSGYTMEGIRGYCLPNEQKNTVTAVAGAWYHVKATVDNVLGNVAFEIYRTTTPETVTTFTLPFSAGHAPKAGVGRFIWLGVRARTQACEGTTGSADNITWRVAVDNIGIKNMDREYAPMATDITISGVPAVAEGDSTLLTTSAEPFGAFADANWSSAFGKVAFTVVSPTSAYAKGLAAGEDTIYATATDGSGTVGKLVFTILSNDVTLVEEVTIGGRNLLKTFYTKDPSFAALRLSATVKPDTATDPTFTWQSLDTDVATVQEITVGNDKFGEVTLTGYGDGVIMAVANDAAGNSDLYSFRVDSNRVATKWYDYSGYDFVELFRNTNEFINLTNPINRGDQNYAWRSASHDYLSTVTVTDNPSRRAAWELKKPANFRQSATIEFDWYAETENTGSTVAADCEVQTTFVDANMNDIFTLFHVVNVEDQFGVVAGPLDGNYTLNKGFGGVGDQGDDYWLSRKGANTEATRMKMIDAAFGKWYHIKAEVNVLTSEVRVTITDTLNASIIPPFTLALPAGYTVEDGVNRILGVYAAPYQRNVSVQAQDRLARIGIKRTDVFTPGQLVDSIAIVGPDTTIIVNKTVQLKATAFPIDVEDYTVTWSSSNDDYATVDPYGLVTAKPAGDGQTVTITATANDGSGTTGTYRLIVIGQPATGISFTSANRLVYPSVAQLGSKLEPVKIAITPSDFFDKDVQITTKSGGSVLEFVSATPAGVNSDTVNALFRVNALGNDSIIVVAPHPVLPFEAARAVKVLADGFYDEFDAIETFADNGDRNSVLGNTNSNMFIVEPIDDVSVWDLVARYSIGTDINGGRGGRIILDRQVEFSDKLLVEFDWQPAATTGSSYGNLGLLSFMSSNDLSDAAQEVFTLYNRNSEGVGVIAGPIPRGGNGGAEFSDRLEFITGVDAANTTFLGNVPLDKWYHVTVSVYRGHRLSVMLAERDGADTFRIALPLSAQLALPNNIGQLVASSRRQLGWTMAVDNIGIKNIDAEVVPATGVKFTADYFVAAIDGDPIEVHSWVQPWNVTDFNVTWSLSDPTKATITPNANASWLVDFKGGSEETFVYLIATTHNGLKDSVLITIGEVKVDSFHISGPSSVSVANTIQLNVDNVWPGNAGDKTLIWSSSDDLVATVDQDGVVTGVSAGCDEAGCRDSVIITATAFDPTPLCVPQTLKVYVEYKPLTGVSLWGAKRQFYSATPQLEPAFTLKPQFTPTDASDKELVWSSTDSAILTVTQSGVVTLVGGFGKAAAKVVNPKEDVEGYYYIEVAAASPYLAFTDFEDNVAQFGGSAITFAAGRAGSQGLDTIQGTRAMRFTGGGTGDRGGNATLATALSGTDTSRLSLRFDWTVATPSANRSYLSLFNSDKVNIISWMNSNVDGVNPDSVMGYTTSHFDHGQIVTQENAVIGLDEASLSFLNEMNNANRSYTIDVTIDAVMRVASFTITERDNPSFTQTVNNVRLNPALNVVNVGGFGLHIARRSNTVNMEQAVDNIGYRFIPVSYVDVTLNAGEGEFESGVHTKTAVVVGGEEFLTALPEPTRECYTFAGWYYDDAYAQACSAEDLALTTPFELYAKWEVRYVTVYFVDAKVGDFTQEVACGNQPIKPTDPVSSDTCDEFDGWFLTQSGGSPYTFVAALYDDLTLYARWYHDNTCGVVTPTSVASDLWPNLSLYPNPVASGNVTVTGLAGGETITVVDVTGSKLLVRTATGEKETLLIGQLPQGVYVVNVSNSRSSKSLKLFVTK